MTTSGASFSEALVKIKAGTKMRRDKWDGEWIGLGLSESAVTVIFFNYQTLMGKKKKCHWIPLQNDILAVDWTDTPGWD